ncbi:MAG TPA: MATE family efflux transporter [Kofleriaceae bacterium]|nr:MATE family efflux transporter [Kofleriaceae bacterium]
MPSAAPLRTLLRLATPMVLARASQSVITFADAIQVKHLGYQAIAATATGGLNVLLVVTLAWGTVFIIQSFVAQLTGRGERDQAPRYAWYGLAIALVAGLVAAALIPLLGPLLALTRYSPAVRDQMTDYMAIRMTSVFAVAGVEAIGNWYGGLGNTWIQMVAGLITMVAAVILNWVLIDGHLGAPAMGVNGAALASTIASFLGFAFVAVAFWRRWGGAPTTRAHGLSLRELRRVLRFGLPNGVNWFFEFAAFQLFVNVVLANLGDTAVAALNVVIAVNSISFMPAFGLASAGAILAGQAIGRGDRGAVWPQVKATLTCTMVWMGAIGLLYAVFPGRVLSLFASERTGELVAIGTTMLVISAAWQLADAVSMTLAEALRAAGDTGWTAGARLILAWLVFTPAAFAVVLWLGGGPVGAMLCLVGYLGLLAAALAWRFRSGAWKRIELIEPALV